MLGRRRWKFCPLLDRLDDRCLLSAAGLTPAQVATAYGLTGLTFGNPAQPADGAGEKIAVVEEGDDPNIEAELAAFDQQFNLPAPASLTVLGQDGSATLPGVSFQGTEEEALDVEWAHALAPAAGIVVVEVNSASTPDLLAAAQTAAAVPGVVVVSMSFGGPEPFNETATDSDFAVAGVTFVAASGDDGAFGGAEWPASSPYVVGVGGTTLQLDLSGDYLGETPWRGSSGGQSRIESEPPYQQGVQSTGARSTPDVAFDGDPNTGVQIDAIDPRSGQGSWTTIAGTSLGAPAWAAIIAIADQGRSLAGSASLGSLQTLTTLYSLPGADFHVIGGGYNNQTGLGTPNGGALIDGLVASQASAAAALAPGATSSPVASTPLFTWPIEAPPIFSNPVVITVITTPAAHKHKHVVKHHPKVVIPKAVHHKAKVALAARRDEPPGAA